MKTASLISKIAAGGLCAAGILALAACDTPSADPAAAKQQLTIDAATGTSSTRSDLTFFDADAFDSDLGQALNGGSGVVDVNFAAPTSINAIPGRINVWLNEVKKSDGRVTMAVDDPQAPPDRHGVRGLGIGMIFDVIDAIITWQERRARAKELAGAHDYDAVIVYDKQTGAAKQVLFERRKA